MDDMEFDFPDVGGIDATIDIDVGEAFSIGRIDGAFPTDERYQKPRRCKTVSAAYRNAEELAMSLDLHRDFRAFCMVSGDFIFGDFIEAMTSLDRWRIDRLTIHTLTMSQDNIDSIENVIMMDEPSQLHIILSDYWYAMERGKKNGLLSELYKKLDIGDGFRVAFCRTHAKMCTIQTRHGGKLVIHGSANMRSHGVIEQFVIENDPDLYGFIEDYNDRILDRYDTINHGAKRKRSLNAKEMFGLFGGRP